MRINKSKIIQAVLCCFLWGTAIPVLKVSYNELNLMSNDFYSRLVLAGLRFLISGIFLFVFYVITKKQIPKIKQQLAWSVVVFAIFNTTLQYLFFYTGVMNTAAIKGVLLDGIKVLLVVVLSHFFSEEDKISVKKIMGIIFGFTGIIIANLNEFSSGQFTFAFTMAGEGMLFLASLVNAIAVIYGKKLMKKIHYLPLNVYQFLIGSIILLIIGLVGTKGFHLIFTPLATGLLIYSGLLSAISFVIWYKLIAQYNPSSISIYIFFIPIFGSIISSIVFVEETITINVILSLVLLTVGIIFMNYTKEEIQA